MLFNVHGGGFVDGDGSDGYYGPDFLIEQNVILVSFNYRLGPFGFANFDIEGYTGNMGLKDQREALKWVYKNIKFFGGDPQYITIFGESAGAASVHYQILREQLCGVVALSIIGLITNEIINWTC